MSYTEHDLKAFSVWHHHKTGSNYVVLGLALCSTNGDRNGNEYSVIYVNTTTGKTYYREVSEFLDGRFSRTA